MVVDELRNLLLGGRAGEGRESAIPSCDEISLPLPTDYIEMVAKIGSDFSIDKKLIVKGPGVIDRFFPQSQRDLEYIHKNTGFFVRGGEILPAGFSGSGAEWISFSNLVCWAEDDSGRKLFWERVGNPDGWRIVATDCVAKFARYEITATDYLYKLLRRSLFCSVFTSSRWPDPDRIQVIFHRVDSG